MSAAGMTCHGRAGSQQPTEPTVHPIVQRGQHVDVVKPPRGSTHWVVRLMQHSVQAPLQPGESMQHDSVPSQKGACGSVPHSDPAPASRNETSIDAAGARRRARSSVVFIVGEDLLGGAVARHATFK